MLETWFSPALHLLIHNTASIVSAVAMFGVTFFAFINGPKKVANVTISLMAFFSFVFIVSHVVGVNILDPEISKYVLMFNLCVFFLGAFNLHAVYALLQIAEKREKILVVVYTLATCLIIFFLIYPDLFLLPSVPKMYFPNYYNAGVFNWFRMVFVYLIIVPLVLYELWAGLRRADSPVAKSQYKYFLWCVIFGYGVGLIPNLLIYNIPVDPLWGMLCGIVFTIPFVYGGVQFKLFSIKVIAKQAFYYAVAILIVGGFIVFLEILNQTILSTYPSFPLWIAPLVSSVLITSIGIVVWRSLRRGDILKYEFITTVTHKFRTPLTYIKWSAENLLNPNLTPEERKMHVELIEKGNEKLVELTNILANASDAENREYEYKMEKASISSLVLEICNSLSDQLVTGAVTLTKHIEPDVSFVCDISRIKFVLQVIIENAVHYSAQGGEVVVSLTRQAQDKGFLFSVKDSGIGIDKKELPLLFSRFYRSDDARKIDTEGMGIGLFVSKEIIGKHNGKIWAKSDGLKKGSVFYVSM
jgi:signal transduction histidine kinase